MVRGWLILALFVYDFVDGLDGGHPPQELDISTLNSTRLWEILRKQENPFIEELSGHWSFNDTLDISKYEDFDHSRYEVSPQLTLEELLEKLGRGNKKRKLQGPASTAAAVTTQSPPDLPQFDTSLPPNSTAQLGGTAYLHCRVRNLNNRAVSWVRRRDWHILTSGVFTYTNDERFHVLHPEGSDDWTLQIKYVQKRDDGAYECQVATGKGSISSVYYLSVVIPTAYILGTGEYHIGQGSTINLVCIIENSPVPPQYVMWYHNEEMINYSSREQGGGTKVQVVTEPGEKTQSKLVITKAHHQHTGNYSCRASNTLPDSVYVFVSHDGDNIAAIQRHEASGSRIIPLSTMHVVLLVILQYGV